MTDKEHIKESLRLEATLHTPREAPLDSTYDAYINQSGDIVISFTTEHYAILSPLAAKELHTALGEAIEDAKQALLATIEKI